MSRRLRMSVLAIASILAFGAGAAWLSLTYLGVISNDVRVQASLTSLGDSLGPGSKVRYHGLIVGTVHDVDQTDGTFSAELLINREHAGEIPRDAVARVLPATLFGSEYVELVGGQTAAAVAGPAIRNGDVLKADDPASTVRLMDSFDDADSLLSAVDAEQINESLGAMATALDGHGPDIAEFLTDADDYVSTMAANRDLLFDDLRLLGTTLQTLAAIEPDLVASAEHSRTTATTITEQHEQISTLIASSTKLSNRTTALLDRDGDHLVELFDKTGLALRIVAEHDPDVTKIFDRVPIVVTNGANGIKGGAVQMEGKIGLNPYAPYTAADCVKFGSTVATNCGNAVPNDPPATPESTAASSNLSDNGLSDLAETVQGLLKGVGSAATMPQSPTTQEVDPASHTDLLGQLLGLDFATLLTLLGGSR